MEEMAWGFGKHVVSPRWHQESKKVYAKLNAIYHVQFLLFVISLCATFLAYRHHLPFAALTMSGGRLAQLLSLSIQHLWPQCAQSVSTKRTQSEGRGSGGGGRREREQLEQATTDAAAAVH